MKFGPSQVAGRRTERREGWIAHRVRIAVTRAGRTGARIRFTYTGDRPPEIIMEFRFPRAHPRIGHRDIHQREESGELKRLELRLIGDLNGDLVIKTRRRAKAWRSVVGPEDADKSLLGRSLRRGVMMPSPPRFLTSL